MIGFTLEAGARGAARSLDVALDRIHDGPTETHKWAIARRAIRQRAGAGT